eukprot:scaffold60014_cov74-Cyclotella_meneghiniana.AAC.4
MTTRHTSSAVSQRWEESNHLEITARTRHRLQKHHPNVFGRQFSRAIQRSVRFIASVDLICDGCVRRHTSIHVNC